MKCSSNFKCKAGENIHRVPRQLHTQNQRDSGEFGKAFAKLEQALTAKLLPGGCQRRNPRPLHCQLFRCKMHGPLGDQRQQHGQHRHDKQRQSRHDETRCHARNRRRSLAKQQRSQPVGLIEQNQPGLAKLLQQPATADQTDQNETRIDGCSAQIGGFWDFAPLASIVQPFLRRFVRLIVIVFAHGSA